MRGTAEGNNTSKREIKHSNLIHQTETTGKNDMFLRDSSANNTPLTLKFQRKTIKQKTKTKSIYIYNP